MSLNRSDGRVACHLCDNLVTRRHKSPDWETGWLIKCSESLAQLLDIEGFGPSFFDSGAYCPTCVTLIADVDFSFRASVSLASRLSTLRTQIATYLLKRLNFAQPEFIESDEILKKTHQLCTDANFNLKGEESLQNRDSEEGYSDGPFVPQTRNLRRRTRIVYQDDNVSDSDYNDLDIGNHDDDEWTNIPGDEVTPQNNLPNIQLPSKRKRRSKNTLVNRKRPRTNPISAEHRAETIQSDSKINETQNLTEKQFLDKMKSNHYFWKRTDEELDSLLFKFVHNSLSPTIDGQIEEDLLVHLLRLEVEEYNQLVKTYICTVAGCQARFRKVTFLKRHLQHEHGINLDPSPFQCIECPALFSFGTALDAHLRRNHAGDPRPYHCEVSGCFEDFIYNMQLDKHIRHKHPNIEAEMGIGSKQQKCHKYRDIDAIKKEPFLQTKGSRRPFKFWCTQSGCLYRTNSERVLCFHVLEKHRDVDTQPYKCDGCGRGFEKRNTYNHHPCIKAGHQCEECGKVLRSAYHLTRHKKRRHKDALCFRCSVCSRLYFRPEDVMLHVKLHTPATENNCVIQGCENPCFDSLEDLRVHVAGPSHDESQSSKVCDLCGYVSKGMKCVDRMKEHMRTHTGEEPFKCRFCDKRFKTRPTRTSHEQINHPDLVEKKIYACKQCDATFTVAQYLFKHNAWHKYGKNACRPIAKKR